MKPRTKLQKRVVEQSNSLAPITQKQYDWAFKNCFEHTARRLKNGTLTCLDCGHSWKGGHALYDTICGCTCSSCGTELKLLDTRKQTFKQSEYFGIITTRGNFQVLRYFFLEKYCKAGNPAQLFCREVVQYWIAPNGKSVVIALMRTMNTWYYNSWNWSFDLEVRNENQAHLITPIATYPHKKYIPEIKRNGFRGSFHRLTPQTLFRQILSDCKMETLFKSKQYDLLRHFAISHYKSIDKYWASIKICIRNNYQVKDATLWCDYIDLLIFFDKDIQNAKYVCPTNLKAEHDSWMLKKQTLLDRQKKEREREHIIENEKQYQKLKSKFLGLEFSEGELHIKVLENVNEFYEEGKTLRHCVYTNEYFLKEDTLIFTAQINGKRIETVEVSLDTLKVIQSRGVCNQNTEYHDQIINLVNKNAHLIRKRMSA